MISDYIQQVAADCVKFTRIIATFKRDNRLSEVEIHVGAPLTPQNLYDAVYPSLVKICEVGGAPKFLSFTRGYGFCGRTGKCKCASQSASANISRTKSTHTPEQKAIALEKARGTFMTKYGVTNPSKDPIIKEKAVAAFRRVSVDTKTKTKNTNWERFVNGHHTRQHLHSDLFDPAEMARLNRTLTLSQIGEKYGVHYQTVSKLFDQMRVTKIDHNRLSRKHSHVSEFEVAVAGFISSMVDVERNVRFVDSDMKVFEVDILVPSLGVAFECNGSYWHSESRGKGPYYHLNKVVACNGLAIRLVHIWEHDWTTKRGKVKDLISCSLCQSRSPSPENLMVTDLGADEAGSFLDQHHFTGNCESDIKLGLATATGEVYAVMSLTSTSPGCFCIDRFAEHTEYHIPDGASRLFHHFVEKYQPTSVVGYSDISRETGDWLLQLGFNQTTTHPPQCHYTKDYVNFIHGSDFQRLSGCNMLESHDPTVFQWDSVKSIGYNRIWDCGYRKHVWTSQFKQR